MSETFFPQLALFVASRTLLALYREFVFPSVPRRTGLLPISVDDVRASNAENTAIAVDIALSKAAVVVYDSGRTRLPLDYIRLRRNQRPIIEVTMPKVPRASVPQPQAQAGNSISLDRPAEMSEWPHDFVGPLLTSMANFSPMPQPSVLAQQLSRLEEEKAYSNLLLTALSLLERRMRMDEMATTVPVEPTGGTMERLQQYFGNDFPKVIEAVSVRHNLLRQGGPQPEVEARVQRLALEIADMARDRYDAPSRSSRSEP